MNKYLLTLEKAAVAEQSNSYTKGQLDEPLVVYGNMDEGLLKGTQMTQGQWHH